ncbi:MAG: FAD binding domain-containing protein [Gammaproteobacteria bacterium]|nr:FAD binding domain-containing protein [Gammaproteobacteria bacterium]
MKAPEFDYVRPSCVEEACAYLAQGDEDEEVRVLAGGQTLVPMMALRLARPSVLVDISRLDSLREIACDENSVSVGACVTQAQALDSTAVRDELPLLWEALGWVAHPAIRSRGTLGGSIANADPAAEIPLVAGVLEADVLLQSQSEARVMSVREFVRGPMETALRPAECLVGVRFPRADAEERRGWGFEEVARRAGDFAVVAAAVDVELDEQSRCRRIRMGLGNVAPQPLWLPAVCERLAGTALGEEEVREALYDLQDVLDPATDAHVDAGYRRWVAPNLLGRAIETARRRASGYQGQS